MEVCCVSYHAKWDRNAICYGLVVLYVMTSDQTIDIRDGGSHQDTQALRCNLFSELSSIYSIQI